MTSVEKLVFMAFNGSTAVFKINCQLSTLIQNYQVGAAGVVPEILAMRDFQSFFSMSCTTIL